MDKTKMDKAKKARIKKMVTWAGLALLVLLLAVMPLLAKSEVEEEGPVASVLSGTVEKADIRTTLKGGGNLKTDDSEDVKIPSGVKITEFLVKNGDVVKEGDPVAVVDKVSVMTAIVEVEDTMDYLQGQIDAVRNEKVSNTIAATAGGRVKVVYADVEDSVQDVMMEHGALAVLSLDGLMAVEIEKTMAILTGDSVCVTFADGTEVEGRVDSNLNGTIVITVEDEDYEIGEMVTVTTEEGEEIGEGQLQVHNAWHATAFTGTISAVYAKENRELSSGSTLFTLKDTDFTAEFEYLSNKHREYEELLQDLFRMYEDGVISAPCEGMISGVDKESTHLLSSIPDGWKLAPLSNVTPVGEDKVWTVMWLSNDNVQPVNNTCTIGTNCPLPADSPEHDPKCIQKCDRNASCDADEHHLDCIKSCDHADTDAGCNATGSHYKDCIKDCDKAAPGETCSSSKHYETCIRKCIITDSSADCPAAAGYHDPNCIESCNNTENCPATKHHYDTCVSHCDNNPSCNAINHRTTCPLYNITYVAYAAKVTSAGSEINVIADYTTVYTVTASANGWSLTPSLNTKNMTTKDNIGANTIGCGENDIVLIMTGTDASGNTINRLVIYQKGTKTPASGMGGFSGLKGFSMPSFSFGGLAGMTGGASQKELFDLEGDVLLTVTPQDTVSVVITVDEQDVLKLYKGQAVEIKVEALKGELFHGEVVEIATSGTNNGGSSKFTAKVRLPYSENMLDGMSANASIPLSTKQDVLTVPVEALVELGAKTVIYTALDEETGDPTNPIPVTVGASDGIRAEIISELQLGDTFYYSYYDTLELDHTAESRFGF